jgi:uncharacterized protein (UPF0276 family)
LELHRQYPRWGAFLEIGVELARPLDGDARAWVAQGLPTTWHFLDINLDEPEDLDDAWVEGLLRGLDELHPAWLCGDAGLWHWGPRDRGQMLLLPPVLCLEQVGPMAEGIARLRELTGREVLPENPPGAIYLGDLHLLEFFGRLAEAADTGLLIDCAHLALYQRQQGHGPLTGLDGLDMERVVELHIAGGSVRDHGGLELVEDDHGVEVLPETWLIAERLMASAPNLRAVILECERNPMSAALPLFAEADRRWRRP